MLAQALEAVMLVCFGLSWPINAYKGFKAGTAAGSSWQFIGLITLGYVAGIVAKFTAGQVNWVLIVYFLNLACLAVNWVVYFRNVKLDRSRVASAKRVLDTGVQLGHVLIATDGSQSALKAVAFAADTMKLGHATTVEVLSVASDGSQTARERSEVALSQASDILDGKGIGCSVRSEVGVPATKIVAAAAGEDVGIVVMGSRGLNGLKEALLGSVSREVIEKVACPVLVVK